MLEQRKIKKFSLHLSKKKKKTSHIPPLTLVKNHHVPILWPDAMFTNVPFTHRT